MNFLHVSNPVNATAVVATVSTPFTADEFKIRSVQAVWTVTTASFSVALQYSNDNATWKDFTTATAITASGNVDWQVLDTKDAKFWRIANTRTSGTLDTYAVYIAYQRR